MCIINSYILLVGATGALAFFKVFVFFGEYSILNVFEIVMSFKIIWYTNPVGLLSVSPFPP